MDKSKIYIKMCDCEELQNNWIPKDGDLFYDSELYKNAKIIHDKLPDLNCNLTKKAYSFVTSGNFICDCGIEHDCYTFDKFYPQDDVIWLPRQDQIQEIVPHEDRIHPFLIKFFYFLTNNIGVNLSIFTTAEQLWLAFYMWEKHKKKWDGKKWIK